VGKEISFYVSDGNESSCRQICGYLLPDALQFPHALERLAASGNLQLISLLSGIQYHSLQDLSRSTSDDIKSRSLNHENFREFLKSCKCPRHFSIKVNLNRRSEEEVSPKSSLPSAGREQAQRCSTSFPAHLVLI